MYSKKGQVTIFIILGILLLVGSFLLFYLSYPHSDDTIKDIYGAGSEVASLKEQVNFCLAKTVVEGTYFISQQGGYYDLPEVPEGMESWAAYYYLDGKYDEMSIPKLEESLKQYVDDMFILCASSVDVPGYDVMFGEDTQSHVMVGRNVISVDVNSDVTIVKDGAQKTVSEFNTVIRGIPVYGAALLANQIAIVAVEELPYICPKCMLDFAAIQGFNVSIMLDDKTMFIDLENFTAYNSNYIYVFNSSEIEEYNKKNISPSNLGVNRYLNYPVNYVYSFAIDIRGANVNN